MVFIARAYFSRNPATFSFNKLCLRYCSNLRAMHILGKGQELGHEALEASPLPVSACETVLGQVPNCVPLYDINVANVPRIKSNCLC